MPPGGQPLELDGEDEHKHGTQPEVGNGDGKQRCGGEQVIQPGIPLECGEDAQRNAHQHSDEDSGSSQVDGNGQAHGNLIDDGLAGGIGSSQIQGEEIFQIDAILNQEWLIQTQAGPDIGDFCFGGAAPATIWAGSRGVMYRLAKTIKLIPNSSRTTLQVFWQYSVSNKFSSRTRTENLSPYEIQAVVPGSQRRLEQNYTCIFIEKQ